MPPHLCPLITHKVTPFNFFVYKFIFPDTILSNTFLFVLLSIYQLTVCLSLFINCFASMEFFLSMLIRNEIF